MNALFLSQLKNMPWVYNDLVVDVDGEAMTIATLIEKYKEAKVIRLTETDTPKAESKPKRTRTRKTTTEK